MALTVDSTTSRPEGHTLPLVTDAPDLGIILQELEQVLAHVTALLERLSAAEVLPPVPAVTLPHPQRLTLLEREVLARVAVGQRNREIAADLHLSPGTVKQYLSSIFARLGARNRADAVRIGRAYHLI